jgi:hypothetical protein
MSVGVIKKHCNTLYIKKSAGKFINIKDNLDKKKQFGGELNFKEKYKKYKKKYLHLKKSDLYSNNGQ